MSYTNMETLQRNMVTFDGMDTLAYSCINSMGYSKGCLGRAIKRIAVISAVHDAGED